MGLVFLFVFLARRYGLGSSRWALGTQPGCLAAATGPQAERSSLPLPTAWLTIRSTNSGAILKALHLHNAIPCSWAEGLVSAGENNLFVSVPIGAWTLVVGRGLPDPCQDIDKCYHFLSRLSLALGHVEFFWRNPALNGHAWAQVECGQVIRGYAWA